MLKYLRSCLAKFLGRNSLNLNERSEVDFRPFFSANSKYGDFAVLGSGCETKMLLTFKFLCF